MKVVEKAIRLRNRTCVYCGADSNTHPHQREHVIGRKFVPKGSFQSNDWNLIVSACRRCNHIKSILEGEISAITLQPGLGTTHADAALRDLAERKAAKARCEATGKVVRDSKESLHFTFDVGLNARFNLGLIAPARLLRDRVKALAEAHIQGFFYFITYNEALRQGGFLPNGIVWFAWAQKEDWGNLHFSAFSTLTEHWICRVSGTAAAGFFRIAIKRDPSAQLLWSFALEWNRNCRVIGFFGDKNAAEEYTLAFPAFEWTSIDERHRMRFETPLKGSEDILFHCSER